MQNLLDDFFGSMRVASDSSVVDKVRVLGDKVGGKLSDVYSEFLCRIEIQEIPAAHDLGGFRFLRCDEVLAAWQSFLQIDDGECEVDPDIAGDWDFRVRRFISNSARLPIAEFNGNVWIFIDFCPAPEGLIGQVVQVDPEAMNWYWLADSFEHMLREILDGRSLNPDMGTQDEDE